MKYKQPVIQLPYTTFERIADAATVACAIIGLSIAVSRYPGLPDQIPSHFNADGNIDGYSSKALIFILPLISLVMTVGLIALSGFPQYFNFPYKITEENAPFEYRKARALLRVVNLLSNLMFLIITWDILRAVNGNTGLSWLFWLVFIALLIAPAGIMLGWKQKRA